MRVGRRDQHGLPTEPHRDALLPGIEGSRRVNTPRDLSAEHRLEKPGCRIRVGAAQVNVIVPVIPHPRSLRRR